MLGKGSPWKSRSTIIFITCTVGLVSVNILAWVAGYFSTEFALVSVYIFRDMMKDCLGHQETSDKSGSPKPV